MAFTLWGYVVFKTKEIEVLSPANLLYSFYHEYYHAKQMQKKGFLKKRFTNLTALEREAQTFAIKKMLSLGYTKKELLELDLEYYVNNKYEWTLKDYEKVFTK